MSCLDYRRVLLSGESEDAAMKAHRLQCRACAAVFAEQAQFESALRESMQVPVPPGLEQRLAGALVGQRRRFLAAASLGVLAAGAGGYAWLQRADPLALACIDFVLMDEAKSILNGSMPREAAERALQSTLPLAQVDRLGQVRFIGPCPFNGQNAYHVIVEVPQGKVTLLVMPESAARAPARASRDGLHASVVPLPRGSVGIIGVDAAVVYSVAGALRG